MVVSYSGCNFWVCGKNSGVCPFKWNLFGSTFIGPILWSEMDGNPCWSVLWKDPKLPFRGMVDNIEGVRGPTWEHLQWPMDWSRSQHHSQHTSTNSVDDAFHNKYSLQSGLQQRFVSDVSELFSAMDDEKLNEQGGLNDWMKKKGWKEWTQRKNSLRDQRWKGKGEFGHASSLLPCARSCALIPFLFLFECLPCRLMQKWLLD